jgi:hypothetical protein
MLSPSTRIARSVTLTTLLDASTTRDRDLGARAGACTSKAADVSQTCSQARHEFLLRVSGSARLFSNLNGTFPVERGSGDTGAMTRAGELLAEGAVLGMFPRGTSKPEGNRTWHRGAARLALAHGARSCTCDS